MRLASFCLTLATLCCPLARAQSAAPAIMTPPPCNGSINIVRISDIMPGMMAKFKEAVAAQQAWYKKSGVADVIVLMPIMERNMDTMTMAYSETEAMTAHIVADGHKETPRDDAYRAFVALYRASSTIKAEYTTCMPKMM